MPDTNLPGRLVVMAVASLLVAMATLLIFVAAMRFNSLWALFLAPLALPALAIIAAIVVRFRRRRGMKPEAPVDGPVC